MAIVDTHCHASLGWYEPVESLLYQMDRNGVDHAVLIQIQGQTNNDYQAECVRRYPGKFASVVIVDVEAPDALNRLSRLVKQGAVGIRLRANERSPGDDPLAIWRSAERLGITVSCAGSANDFGSRDFARLVEALPRLRIVIEHLAGLKAADADPARRDVVDAVFALARFPSVAMKLPALGEFCRRLIPVAEPFPFAQPIPSFIEDAYRAFGPGRLMWGSDFPPVSSREGYTGALRFTREQLASKSEADQALVFGDTALHYFPMVG